MDADYSLSPSKQVKKMIQMGHCRGIRYAPTKNISTERDTNVGGELVSWFLQYPDGSMGMLYTTPVSLNELAMHFL